MASQELSSDIIFEILTRTSLKSLDSCKAVCKSWNKLTYESSFMPTYCKRTKNVFGYFVQDLKHNTNHSMFVSFDHQEGKIESLPRDMKILASCDQGVLCCLRTIKGRRDYRYYACKPTTRQWQALPNPKMRYREAGVAITAESVPYLRFKIVRLSCRGIIEPNKAYYKYRCEVFDSKFWSWKELEEDIILPYEELILRSSPAISAGNYIHWITSDDNVLAFSQRNNTFHKFPLPEPIKKNNLYNCRQLLDYEGKLGVTYLTVDENMELWTLEKRRTNEWTRKMGISLESLENVVKYPSPAGFYNSEIMFMKAYQEMVFFKLQDTSYKRVDLDNLNEARDIFVFRSDWEPVNLRGPRLSKSRKKKPVWRLPMIVFLVLCFCFFVCYFSFRLFGRRMKGFRI